MLLLLLLLIINKFNNIIKKKFAVVVRLEDTTTRRRRRPQRPYPTTLWASSWKQQFQTSTMASARFLLLCVLSSTTFAIGHAGSLGGRFQVVSPSGRRATFRAVKTTVSEAPAPLAIARGASFRTTGPCGKGKYCWGSFCHLQSAQLKQKCAATSQAVLTVRPSSPCGAWPF